MNHDNLIALTVIIVGVVIVAAVPITCIIEDIQQRRKEAAEKNQTLEG